MIADVASQRPVDADMVFGRERIRALQVVKQADVLMLHYLVPDELATGSLEPNLDSYGPRTAHGSTLSPGVYAALLAVRVGPLRRSRCSVSPPGSTSRHRPHDRRRDAPRRDGQRLEDAGVRLLRTATGGATRSRSTR